MGTPDSAAPPPADVDPSVPPPPSPAKLAQARALKLLALGALAALVWIARPVGVGLFLGVLPAFTLQPIYGRLRARAWSARTAALTCVLATTTLMTAAAVAFAALVIRRGVLLVEGAPQLFAEGGELRTFVARTMTVVHIDPAPQFAQLHAQAVTLGSRAAEFAADLAAATFTGLLTLLFVALAGYYVLLHWNEIVRHAEHVLPFAPRHTRALLGQFRNVGSDVLRGVVLTGLVQGSLAGLGYWVTGLPDPFFFGALTAVASLVPAVGTLLVWVPAGVYLIGTGHVAAGVVELVYGALIVGIVTDYVIRPRLVGRGSRVPAVLTLVSLFGGVEMFGLTGLVVGPIIVTLCLAALKTYEKELAEA